MALIFLGQTKCSICGEVLQEGEDIVATSHFIADSSYDLWGFSDAPMDWDCYAKWEHQRRFAFLYFEFHCANGVNPYWRGVWKSEDVLVTYGVAVRELDVCVRNSASRFRIQRDDWSEWTMWKWQKDCEHPLELSELEKVIPQLKNLRVPEII